MSRGQETVWILVDDAQTSTTSAPSAATDGKSPPGLRPRDRVHLEYRKAAASGTRTLRLKVYAYRSKYFTQAAGGALTEVATGGWALVYDTGTLSSAADFNERVLLEGLGGAERVGIEVVTNGGTTPTVTTLLGFDDDALGARG